MADEILCPQGLEAADTIADNNIVEVYQPDSDGTRRNKQETVDVMKTYYRTMPSYTSNQLLMASSVGLPVISSVSQSEVTTVIAQTSTNTSDIGALEDKVGQSLNTGDSPTFSDINITGLSDTVENSIETNASNISSNDTDISTNASNIASNDTDITALQSRATTNESDIDTLEGKVGQSLNTTDDVTFNSVTTDNVAIKHKLLTGTLDSSGLADFSHSLTLSKIITMEYSRFSSNSNGWRISTSILWDASDVSLFGGSSEFYDQSYKVLVTYQA